MTISEVHHFTAPDGIRLAWREMGAGRPIVLIHGFMSDAVTNWMRYAPTAATVAAAGYRVIMPDLRAHGDSERSHDPAAYPPDILADDQFALIDHLGLTDFDLGGYSLGGWTTAQMLARGCRPGRAIIAGMGLEGLIGRDDRAAHFRHILTNLGSHSKGSPAWLAEAFLKTNGGDPVALTLLLDSFTNSSREALAATQVPVAVICGVDDQDNGNAQALTELLPDAVYSEIPGNHMSAVTKPELGAAMAAFLTQKSR
jgi:pimeloyl-ACP methyl ester carboxylesterase